MANAFFPPVVLLNAAVKDLFESGFPQDEESVEYAAWKERVIEAVHHLNYD